MLLWRVSEHAGRYRPRRVMLRLRVGRLNVPSMILRAGTDQVRGRAGGVMPGDQVDRSRLPIADPEFTGVANRTLEGSRPDWGLIGHVAPPEGAPNVLLVLLDDAGFGPPGGVVGPRR